MAHGTAKKTLFCGFPYRYDNNLSRFYFGRKVYILNMWKLMRLDLKILNKLQYCNIARILTEYVSTNITVNIVGYNVKLTMSCSLHNCIIQDKSIRYEFFFILARFKQIG